MGVISHRRFDILGGFVSKQDQPFVSRSGYEYSYLLFNEKKFANETLVREESSFFNQYQHVGFIIAILYVIVVFSLQAFMHKRKRFQLRLPLILWNLSLSTFSILGTIRFWPEFLYTLWAYGFEHSICNINYIYDITGYWTYLFILSKIPELVDTLFIVLRKQELIFLHWYHHATVLLYAWYCYALMPASGRWFIAMNYLVHAIMYTYYALKAMSIHIPKKVSVLLTTSQIVQMIVGCFINYSVWQLKRQNPGKTCETSDENIKWSFVMYLSYFILFTKFFIDIYIFNLRQKTNRELINKIHAAQSTNDEKLKSS